MTKKRAALWVVATIFGPLLLCWLTSTFYIGTWYARTGHHGPPTPEIMIQAMFVGLPPALLTVVALWWWIHRNRAAFSELYLTRSNAVAADLVIGIALGVLWVAVYGLFDVVSWRDMFTFDAAKMASVPATLSAGFCEEFLYRGFLFWLIAFIGGGKVSRLAIASIAFGVAHCFWGHWGMVWTTILGFTFGLVVLWRGNVWPAVVAHTLLNLCIEPALLEKALTGGFNA